MKLRLLALATAVSLLLAPAALHAQVTVIRGTQFAVEWNSEYPNDFARYRFFTFVDNVQTKAWTQAELTATAAPLPDCFGTATPPAGATCFLYRGTHAGLNNTGTRVLKVRVTDAGTLLNSAFSPDVSFSVVAPTLPPIAPTNPRVVVVTVQAGVTFEFKSGPVTVDRAPAAPAENTLVTVRVPPASAKK
jgi:hypothetical protein